MKCQGFNKAARWWMESITAMTTWWRIGTWSWESQAMQNTPFFAVAKALCNTTVLKGENMFLQRVLIVWYVWQYPSIILYKSMIYQTVFKQLWLDCTINDVSMISIDQPSFRWQLHDVSEPRLENLLLDKSRPGLSSTSKELLLISCHDLESHGNWRKTWKNIQFLEIGSSIPPKRSKHEILCVFLPMSMWFWLMV